MKRYQVTINAAVFESTAYVKFAKLQYDFWLSLPDDCRVTDEALLAETT